MTPDATPDPYQHPGAMDDPASFDHPHATHDRAANEELGAAYRAGIVEGESRAAQMVTMIVEAAGGEVTVTRKMALSKLRLERHDDVTTGQTTFRVAEDV